MRQIYEVWQDKDGGETTLTTHEGIEQLRAQGGMENTKFFFQIEAATYEEVRAIFNLRMGFEPYKPQGSPKSCPKNCGMMYYPEDSGECPNCGKIR